MPSITRREWRNVLIFAVGVMFLTTLPYLTSAAAQRPDWRFGWILFGREDGNSYFAKMRQGAVDGWLFHIVFTSEAHDGAFLFTPYLAGGKIAALFASPSSPDLVDAMILVFHAARVLFGILLILVTYRFIAEFLPKRSLRWLALILICLGGGFGWLLILIGKGSWLGSPLPVDMLLPEGYTFYLLYGLPHLSLARAALLGGLLLIFRTLKLEQARQWIPWVLLAGVCWLIVGLCVPFYIGVLYAILGVWGIGTLLRHRRFPVDLFVRCLVGAALPVPLLLYNFYVFTTNTVLGAWSSQNILPSPHPLHYVFGYGLLAVLSFPAICWAWQRGKHRTKYLLLSSWVIAGPILAYLPIGVQRRLLEAIFVPLCILASMGVRLWWRSLPFSRRQKRQIWQPILVMIIVLLIPTPLILFMSGIPAGQWFHPANYLFHSTAEINALDWMNTHLPANSVVLSSKEVGNYLPVRTSLRAFIGHSPETLNLDRKLPLVADFLADTMTPTDRQALYKTYGIQYVIAHESVLNYLELRLLYDQASYRIYEVLPIIQETF
jgi:hypothetical protein